ncbi:tetratricopeptide repeat-containing serine/threonine-protein kinase [Edaphobacter paludis]|uniref:non-specific serine/threonine protein kinase n=1 Tax=Edaphobacter paludis TaxID=3035702 RepID=A0AAU7D5F5_9BACT
MIHKTLGNAAKWAVKISRWNFEQQPFFIQGEFCGLDLAQWASTDEFISMSCDERIRLTAQITDAVASAHALGIVHNDLKPTNVFVGVRTSDSDAENSTPKIWQIKIGDFGVASLLDRQQLRDLDITDYGSAADPANEHQGISAGTVMYRAPELYTGSAPTPQADIYALGVLLYQIVLGDFRQQISPGWEAGISDPTLRQDIAEATDMNPALRLKTAAELGLRLHNIEGRRVEHQRGEIERENAKRNEEILARARVRRPWIVTATAMLVLGLLGSWGLYRRAVREKNLAEARNLTLSSMYGFLAQDLLGQTNPYLNVPGANIPQQTLLDALRTALPRIDKRFSREPEIAARLHGTIADSFKSRTEYIEADKEYTIAAEKFREAEGPLSQNAILTELRKENADLSSRLPGSVGSAEAGFKVQQSIIAKLDHPSPELLTWEAFIGASVIGLGEHPKSAIPMLTDAVYKAETHHLDPALLISLRARICGIYVILQDGPNLERTSRELISQLRQQYGSESPSLNLPFMYLQEALYLDGKYPEAITQANKNFARFSRLLGPNHELTLATLANRAASEGQLGRYEAAVQDDLKIHAAEHSNPSGSRMEEGSLADAAMYECHARNFRSGISHARQVISETSNGPKAQPMYTNGAMFTLAECLIGQEEEHRPRPNSVVLDRAESLLRRVDVKSTDQLSGGTDYEGWRNLAWARLALLREQEASARLYEARAQPSIERPDADPYEKKALLRVRRRLYGSPGTNSSITSY